MTEFEPKTSGVGSNYSTTEPQPLPIFFKLANPDLFFIYLCLFKHTLQI